MISYLSSYIQPIMWACMLFPFIAGIFTIPFVVRQYRKYGGIAFMRVIVVYSFILYLMCAFLLTVLPLPTIEQVLAMPDHPIGWIPYVGFRHGLVESGFSLTDPASWKRFLKCDDFLQCFYNVVMTVPLGIYLRYYFKCSFKKTMLLGFLASLFFEGVQYSALFGIYPKPYRYTEVDDLINNTLGAVIGFGIEPLFARFIPSRKEIDRLSYVKGQHVTFMRRLFAIIIDYVFFNVIFALTEGLFIPVNGTTFGVSVTVFFTEAVVYFVILPLILKGRTPGQALLKLKLADERGRKLTWQRVVVRNVFLYFIEFFMAFLAGFLLSGLVGVLMAWESNSKKIILIYGLFTVGIVFIMLSFVLRCIKKYNTLPHSHYSHTVETVD